MNLMLITGSAIKCFECNSHKDPNCALDIPPDNLLKDCSTEYPSRPNGASTYCRKIKQNIDIEVNNCEYPFISFFMTYILRDKGGAFSYQIPIGICREDSLRRKSKEDDIGHHSMCV